ncbi:MAG TPA: glycerophosphodiester phosphodiesterase [Gemmatimonadales bacterium]|nr:glycerophosphodiester phosphodiesterase [Gemmatimonadales bacterium]
MTEPRRPSVIAHRGASGHAYENSPAAFRRAVALGADGVELDIHATADGALLVHHDPEVRGLGPISTLPRSAFLSYRLPNGEPIPTLAEALALCAGLAVWVEVKTLPPDCDAVLLETLDAGPTPGRYAVHGFDHRIVERLGERRPGLQRGVLLASYLLDTLTVLRTAGAHTLWMETHLIDQALVDLVHSAGGQIISWTANDDAEIRRLIRLGVDGICGNYPDRITSAL